MQYSSLFKEGLLCWESVPSRLLCKACRLLCIGGSILLFCYTSAIPRSLLCVGVSAVLLADIFRKSILQTDLLRTSLLAHSNQIIFVKEDQICSRIDPDGDLPLAYLFMRL